jgi:hypothetical protein
MQSKIENTETYESQNEKMFHFDKVTYPGNLFADAKPYEGKLNYRVSGEFKDAKPYDNRLIFSNTPQLNSSIMMHRGTIDNTEEMVNRGVASRSPYPEIWARYPQNRQEEDEWVIELMVKPQYWPEWKKKRGYTAEIRK